MRGNYIYGNKSGIKARDSEILFIGNYVSGNVNGVNFFRSDLTARKNMIFKNVNEGITIREGTTRVRENLFACNRYGLRVNDSFYGSFAGNVISNNYETGVSIRNSDNVDIKGNFIQGSGFNGVNMLSSGALLRGNHISRNGERGIGIQSFIGMITQNSIVDNGLYALENEGGSAVMAAMNWWGGERESVIYDGSDEPGRGKVTSTPALERPPGFVWPLKSVRTDVTWSDIIMIEDPLSVIGRSVITISPGTTIMFSENAGMRVSKSRVIATGNKDKRITFTVQGDGSAKWDEILLEHAEGSVFSYCDFEHANWALHSHFTDLRVSNSRFSNNNGGMRFRSGPMQITDSLFTGNRIGMRAFRADARIMKNDIINNETGLFVREKGGGLTLRNNNIHSNKDYNIRVGDFNEEDIDARENWWGTLDPAGTMYDGRKEPAVGKVIFDPYLKEPVRVGR
jgi:parallel beta-helix repeat protein